LFTILYPTHVVYDRHGDWGLTTPKDFHLATTVRIWSITILIVMIYSDVIIFLGMTIKLCTFEDAERMTVRTEDKTFYTEEDFRDFLSQRGWTLLREYGGYRIADTLDDLRPGAIYQGMRSLGD
jgi:hypothetical protein